MKVVIQRVKSAYVKVNEEVVGNIHQGLLVLAGFESTDSNHDFEWISKKITQLRIFNDEQKTMNRSCLDIEGEILVVSQFTLFASTQKGNRPSYIKAAPPEIADALYNQFIATLKQTYSPAKVKTGIFGAHMEVGLTNDGPVTIVIDSKLKT
ncbi:MAG: D-tyrosyl-tRNA(Tyr) deacylase [Bacteroidetes bacterium]|nr:MAG: D-tyrosyl-tRNA(Tyr) deacylase [Bacteroidota bacterium]